MSMKLGVLISGSGRTLSNLNEKINSGKLKAEISVVISSKKDVLGIEVAKKYSNHLEIVARKDFKNTYEFSNKVFEILKNFNVDIVVLAGWIHKLHIPKEYEYRVLNIHPALLPLFGGFKYYGDFVHRAVIESGVKVSGCTVHYVTNDYDSGPIILQECVKVEEGDTPEILSQRVFEKEKELYPKAIELILKNTVKK